MRSPADIIAHLLVNLGLCTLEDEWPISVAILPDTPDEAVCAYDTGGRMDGRILRTGEQIVHPGIQIRVRGKDYLASYAKIRAIALLLDLQNDILVAFSDEEVYVIQNVSRTGDILPLGIEDIDGRRCHNFTMNAVLTLREEEAITPPGAPSLTVDSSILTGDSNLVTVDHT